MERCLSNGVNMRPRLGFPYPEEAGLAPLWAAGVAPEGKDEKNGPNGGGWVYTAGRPRRRRGSNPVITHHVMWHGYWPARYRPASEASLLLNAPRACHREDSPSSLTQRSVP